MVDQTASRDVTAGAVGERNETPEISEKDRSASESIEDSDATQLRVNENVKSSHELLTRSMDEIALPSTAFQDSFVSGLMSWRLWSLRLEYARARGPTFMKEVLTETGNVYVMIWFSMNIIITLASKLMFSNLHFPFPLLLTGIHLAVTGLGCQILKWMKAYEPSPAGSTGSFWNMFLFSLVFTLNIWLSNYSLMVVSVGAHQVARTLIPIFTLFLSAVIYRETYPLALVPSILLVIFGVIITVKGDMTMTLWGLSFLVFGCFFSSLKGLMSQKAQLGPKGLNTIDMLRMVCPMAVVEILVFSVAQGELKKFRDDPLAQTSTVAILLLIQGLIAFVVNIVSFRCAALKNPLTMNIAGNLKQAVTPLIYEPIFGSGITFELICGLVLSTVGVLWYGAEMGKVRKTTV